MHDLERHQHLLHSQLPAFARKVDWSRQIIEDALAKGGRWYLGFSGGIDSTVVLHLLYTAGHRIDVCWGDNGWDFPETLHFLRATEAHYGIHIKRYRTVESFQDFAREMGRPDLAEDYDAPGAWNNPPEWDAVHLLKDTSFEGYDGVFLGLLGTRAKRGGESRARFLQLRGGARPLYRSASDRNTWHCCPLAAWSKRDVWAYIASRGVPYNPVYDTLAALGVPLERRRCTELTCYRVAQYGAFVQVHSGWPDLYTRFAAVFPAVRAYR
jgi:3'-phosphoadenosine 5'-phosphosulfate sulfotransferase (PAPS reductase)/FAD synthetase